MALGRAAVISMCISQLLVRRLSAMASVYVTHGGGPYPLLEKELHKTMFEQFESIQKRFPSPKGIIVFSAHW
jgi:4,5-DOPA dioxygenase extradiol